MRCAEKGSLDTHINQGFVFLSVLEKIENRLHICLLQDQNIWIYGKDKKNKNNFRWIIRCQINCCTAERCHLHLALMRLCARSLVSSFSSSVRGGWGVGGGDSGHSLLRRLSMYAAICTCVGFTFLRKEFTFLEKNMQNSWVIHRLGYNNIWPMGAHWCHLLFQNGHKRFQNSIEDIYEDGVSCKGNKSVSVILEQHYVACFSLPVKGGKNIQVIRHSSIAL